MAGEAYPHWETLHPVARGSFQALADDLAKSYGLRITRTLFRPFELYRSPVDQQKLLAKQTTRAKPWFSPHQYGLAVDFVPFVNGRWTWDGNHDWEFLARTAKARGLECQTPGLEWDRPHVQSPIWHVVRAAYWTGPSGSVA